MLLASAGRLLRGLNGFDYEIRLLGREDPGAQWFRFDVLTDEDNSTWHVHFDESYREVCLESSNADACSRSHSSSSRTYFNNRGAQRRGDGCWALLSMLYASVEL